jgi:hypothetical protein
MERDRAAPVTGCGSSGSLLSFEHRKRQASGLCRIGVGLRGTALSTSTDAAPVTSRCATARRARRHAGGLQAVSSDPEGLLDDRVLRSGSRFEARVHVRRRRALPHTSRAACPGRYRDGRPCLPPRPGTHATHPVPQSHTGSSGSLAGGHAGASHLGAWRIPEGARVALRAGRGRQPGAGRPCA